MCVSVYMYVYVDNIHAFILCILCIQTNNLCLPVVACKSLDRDVNVNEDRLLLDEHYEQLLQNHKPLLK